MAGRGPAPADPAQRRRRNAPARGDWTELGPLEKPVLPALPKRSNREGGWSTRTRTSWKAWREDPVTGVYGPAEIAAALELVYLLEEHVREGGVKLASEVRMRMDGLGLTLKGKRDLRMRIADQASDDVPDEVAARRARRSTTRAVRAIDSTSG